MGGLGSGRRGYGNAKPCTDSYRALDVRAWKRDGLLACGRAFSCHWTRAGVSLGSIQVQVEAERVVLSYRQRSGDADWKSERYPVRLTWTDCHLGGQRPWLLCPVAGCGRRVATLYGGAIFACRHCQRLVYRSQREARDDRNRRRAEKLREKLGWEPGILNGRGWKPRGMHWRTFWRLSAEHDRCVDHYLASMTVRIERIEAALESR